MRSQVRGMTGESGAEPEVLRLAVVSSGSQVVFAAVAVSDPGLVRRLAEYVGERAPLTLWPDDARRVAGLLEAGRLREGVAAYFSSVGGRWDPEHLDVRTVPVEPAVPERTFATR